MELNDSKIVFLKRYGRSSYSKAGAYRSIPIPSYIGKLLERILAPQIEIYLKKVGIIDVNQAGMAPAEYSWGFFKKLITLPESV